MEDFGVEGFGVEGFGLEGFGLEEFGGDGFGSNGWAVEERFVVLDFSLGGERGGVGLSVCGDSSSDDVSTISRVVGVAGGDGTGGISSS